MATKKINWKSIDKNRAYIGMMGARRFLLKKSGFGVMGAGTALALKTKHKDESEWKPTEFLFLVSGDIGGAIGQSHKKRYWTKDGTEFSDIHWNAIRKEVQNLANYMF